MPKGTVYLLHLFNSTFGNVHLKEERKLLDQGDLNVLKSLLRLLEKVETFLPISASTAA